jgi:flagellar biosynthetic protein FliP
MINALCKKYGIRLLCLLFIIVGILTLIKPITVVAASNETTANVLDDDELIDVTNTLFPDTTGDDNSSFNISYENGNGSLNGALRILLILTLISFLPAMLVMLTSFTRIIIVMHFTRSALGTQTSPPNQVLIGLTIFLTIFIMSPVFLRVTNEAIKPFDAGEITQEEAMEKAMEPFREFMYGQTQSKDVNVFMQIAGLEWDGTPEGVPTTVLIPSFMLSELRTSFIIGFLIYIPFVVIDMVVASVLMSMGMMMLPPTTISMPFKILLFVLADGWNLVIVNLVKSFY